jgi:hypothetical protein
VFQAKLGSNGQGLRNTRRRASRSGSRRDGHSVRAALDAIPDPRGERLQQRVPGRSGTCATRRPPCYEGHESQLHTRSRGGLRPGLHARTGRCAARPWPAQGFSRPRLSRVTPVHERDETGGTVG